MAIAVGIQSVFLASAALLSFIMLLTVFQVKILAIARTYCFITLVVGELLRDIQLFR